jgi:phosphatidylinositol glycan class Q protein
MTVYHHQLKLAGSLWNLFCGTPCISDPAPSYTAFYDSGKRYNILRNRNDSWDYDMDQLLFGTMLFTLLAFLFPTVLAYYMLFALVSVP